MSPPHSIRLPEGGRFLERLVAAGIWAAAICVGASLVWIVGDVFWRGMDQVGLEFLVESPRSAGRAGGIWPILVSTLMILAVAMGTAIPIGLGCAIWLSEFTRRGGWTASLVGRALDVLAAVPSIVFGLFGNALFCDLMGMGYSILAGGLTLSCMVLPILIRTIETSLHAVPDDFRIAALSLGISRTRATWAVLLPAASAGVLVGIVLGMGRVLAETAALLFTSGYVDRMPRGVMDSGRALSVHIYDLSMNIPGGEANAYASALVLIGFLIVLNFGTTWLAEVFFRHRSRAR